MEWPATLRSRRWAATRTRRSGGASCSWSSRPSARWHSTSTATATGGLAHGGRSTAGFVVLWVAAIWPRDRRGRRPILAAIGAARFCAGRQDLFAAGPRPDDPPRLSGLARRVGARQRAARADADRNANDRERLIDDYLFRSGVGPSSCPCPAASGGEGGTPSCSGRRRHEGVTRDGAGLLRGVRRGAPGYPRQLWSPAGEQSGVDADACAARGADPHCSSSSPIRAYRRRWNLPARCLATPRARGAIRVVIIGQAVSVLSSSRSGICQRE